MQTISFKDADPLLNWTMIADALQSGHQLTRANVGDLLLQSGPNSLLNRGAWIDGLGMALKSMSVFPQNGAMQPPLPTIQGGVLLFESVSGALKAVIDGILVTKWKTAADSVLGARLLANPEPEVHLTVGAGTVSSTVISAYREVFPSIRKFMIWNRTGERAQQVADALGHQIDLIEVVDDLELACAEADVITTCTMAKTPVIKGEWIKPATHLDLIGAFKPDMREVDDETIRKSRVFVDSRETTIGHIGEIEIPLRSGVLAAEDILADLYQMVGEGVGRTAENEITLFKNGGGAHLDLMTCSRIYEAVNAA